MTFMFDSGVIYKGDIRCSSFLGAKGLREKKKKERKPGPESHNTIVPMFFFSCLIFVFFFCFKQSTKNKT